MKINTIFNKKSRWFTTGKLGFVFIFLFILSMLPIWYVGFFNHATADDYWYGLYTYNAWQNTHSFAKVLQAAANTVKEFYFSWQGTWFTIFFFSLQPEVFHENAYFIVVLISTGLIIASVSYILYDFVVREVGISRGSFFMIDTLILYMIFQYMPRTTSGIYWYNGIIHYVIPLALALVAIVHIKRYLIEKKMSSLVIVTLCMTALGGSNYLAALLAIMVLFLMVVFKLIYDKKERWSRQSSLLVIPLILEVTGLLISATAPGNYVRSEELEISLKWMLQTIYYSIDRGIYLTIDDYLGKYPAYLIVFGLVIIIVWFEMKNKEIKFRFPYPVLFVLYMCGIYWAMYAPGIFSKSDVSGGVPDTIQQVFLLTSLANIIYLIGWLQRILKEHNLLRKNEGKSIFLIPAVLLAFVVALLLNRWINVERTNDYCLECIQNGELTKYDRVMDQQNDILWDDEIKDAVIPEYEAPYPLLHMKAETDSKAQRNQELQRYFNKDSVTAYDVN